MRCYATLCRAKLVLHDRLFTEADETVINEKGRHAASRTNTTAFRYFVSVLGLTVSPQVHFAFAPRIELAYGDFATFGGYKRVGGMDDRGDVHLGLVSVTRDA